jgi:transposase
VIDGILHRVRTGVHWRDLPEHYGPWKSVYERHRAWLADGIYPGSATARWTTGHGGRW